MDLAEVLKNIDIIRIFKDDIFSTVSVSQIEKTLGLSHHPTFRRLKVLEQNAVVVKRKGGYAINVQNPLVYEILKFLSEFEKIEHANKRNR